MALPSIEELSPRYLREDRIDLTLEPNTVPRAFGSILVNVSYERTKPEGVMLPLILEVQGPSAQSYQRRVFHRKCGPDLGPPQVIFTPIEGGPHIVVLREAAHNYWWGRLRLNIEGERLLEERPL